VINPDYEEWITNFWRELEKKPPQDRPGREGFAEAAWEAASELEIATCRNMLFRQSAAQADPKLRKALFDFAMGFRRD
jgi:hypothetical protein